MLLSVANGQQTVAVEELLETLTELGRHQVVENRIDGRVQVQHDPAEVQQVVVGLHAQTLHVFVRCNDDPQGEHAKGQEAGEECHYDSAQHENDLLARLVAELRLIGAHLGQGHVVGNQILGYDRVQNYEDHQGQHKEHGDGHQKERDGPDVGSLRETDGHPAAIHVLLLVAELSEK